MISTNALRKLLDKNIEVFTTRSSFKGICSIDCADNVYTLVLTPTDKWMIDRYGPVIIDVNSIIAVRLIKPHKDEDDDDRLDSCEDVG